MSWSNSSRRGVEDVNSWSARSAESERKVAAELLSCSWNAGRVKYAKHLPALESRGFQTIFGGSAPPSSNPTFTSTQADAERGEAFLLRGPSSDA